MKNIKVSVIIPTHNNEKYLDKCLTSLMAQTLSDIEIIIINDGSTDNSKSIINKFIKVDNRFILINLKSSKGPGYARNKGILKAKGKFIAFVDSDDYVTSNMFNNMYTKAKSNRSDVVFCNFNMVDEDNKILMTSTFVNNLKESGLNYLSQTIKSNISAGIWGKLYKRKFILEYSIVFDVKNNYEDIMFNFLCAYHTNKINFLNETHYSWLQRNDSRSKNISIQNINDRIETLDKIKQFLSKKKVYNQYEKDYIEGFIKHLYIYMYNTISKTDFSNEILLYLINKANMYLLDLNYDSLHAHFMYDKVLSVNNNFYSKILKQTDCSLHKNLEFSKNFNLFYQKVFQFEELNSCVIYGYGTIGKTIQSLIPGCVLAFIDQNSNVISKDIKKGEVYNPKNLVNMHYDKIIVSVLGREHEIVKYLIDELNISKEKIAVLEL